MLYEQTAECAGRGAEEAFTVDIELYTVRGGENYIRRSVPECVARPEDVGAVGACKRRAYDGGKVDLRDNQ